MNLNPAATPPEPRPQPDFVQFWAGLSEAQRKLIRHECVMQGMHPTHLYLVATGVRKAGARTLSRLLAADPRITKEMVRPDLFPQSKPENP